MGQDLYLKLTKAKEELRKSINDMYEWGIKKANAEKEYKIALNKYVLNAKAEGQAIGIIDKSCYGDEEVAKKRLERDIADVTYEATKEKINATKLDIKTLDAQIQREWINS